VVVLEVLLGSRLNEVLAVVQVPVELVGSNVPPTVMLVRYVTLEVSGI
jgi:hypothetical protein